MPLLLGGFGFYGAIFLSTYLGIDFEYAWVGLAVLCGARRLVADLPRHRALDPDGHRPRR